MANYCGTKFCFVSLGILRDFFILVGVWMAINWMSDKDGVKNIGGTASALSLISFLLAVFVMFGVWFTVWSSGDGPMKFKRRFWDVVRGAERFRVIAYLFDLFFVLMILLIGFLCETPQANKGAFGDLSGGGLRFCFKNEFRWWPVYGIIATEGFFYLRLFAYIMTEVEHGKIITDPSEGRERRFSEGKSANPEVPPPEPFIMVPAGTFAIDGFANIVLGGFIIWQGIVWHLCYAGGSKKCDSKEDFSSALKPYLPLFVFMIAKFVSSVFYTVVTLPCSDHNPPYVSREGESENYIVYSNVMGTEQFKILNTSAAAFIMGVSIVGAILIAVAAGGVLSPKTSPQWQLQTLLATLITFGTSMILIGAFKIHMSLKKVKEGFYEATRKVVAYIRNRDASYSSISTFVKEQGGPVERTRFDRPHSKPTDQEKYGNLIQKHEDEEVPVETKEIPTLDGSDEI